MVIGSYEGDGFSIYLNRFDAGEQDGIWYLWHCTCETGNHKFRTVGMMLSSAQQHLGWHHLTLPDHAYAS